MNIDGLGPETVDRFFQHGLLKNVADLYTLRVEDMVQLERLGEKTAENIVKSVMHSTEVSFERVLFALGIRFVGETVAKKLAVAFKDIDKLSTATIPELLEVNEIGERIAQSVQTYFRNAENQALIERLRMAGVQLALGETEYMPLSQTLAGKSIVISGVFSHHSRDEYKVMIEKHGGKNIGSISKKTSFVLAGENMGPAKLEKATSLGVAIVNEDEFLQMLSTTEEVQDINNA